MRRESRYGRILVVDDEPAARNAVCHILARRGYEVIEAENGFDALRAYEDREGEIDLLVTDIIMPKMAGYELAQRLRTRRPDLKVLFVSGYSLEVLSREHGVAADIRASFLQKPFLPGLLEDKVKQALSRPARSEQ
jgi:CheY-like chemotaxis protein